MTGEALNAASKALFYKQLKEREDGDSIKGREEAKKIRAYAKDITCFYCLDYKIVYKDREGVFSSLDGRGNFDIINCTVCTGNENWIKCSSGPTTEYPGIFKRGDRERYWFERKVTGVADSLVDKLMDKINSA